MTHVKISGKHTKLIENLRQVARKALSDHNDIATFDTIWDAITELQCEALAAQVYGDALKSVVGK